MALVKRSKFKSFLNISGDILTPEFALISEGISSMEETLNPEVSKTQYIDEDSATQEIESYAPTMDFDAEFVQGDDVLDFLEEMKSTLPTLGDAHADIVQVRAYMTPTGAEYPAKWQEVAVKFDSQGTEAGKAMRIKGTFLYVGDPIYGTFNLTTLAFTPDSAS